MISETREKRRIEIMQKLEPLAPYWNFTLAAEIMKNDKVWFINLENEGTTLYHKQESYLDCEDQPPSKDCDYIEISRKNKAAAEIEVCLQGKTKRARFLCNNYLLNFGGMRNEIDFLVCRLLEGWS